MHSMLQPTLNRFAPARCLTALLLLGLVLAACAAHGRPSAFEHAEKMREALEGRPQQERTRGEYERVLAAYRAIAQGPWADADAAVDATAGLLAEEGRAFRDRGLLLAAVEQYALLRRAYPASHFRQSALLSQAEIAASDLHDDAQAQARFTEFLAQYPHSPLAGEARQQLSAVRQHAVASPVQGTGAHAAATTGRAAQAAQNARQHAQELAELNAAGNDGTAQVARPSRRPATHEMPSAVSAPDEAAATHASASSSAAGNGGPVLITSIRHWSTPIYTRVAIDLSDQVLYEAGRVPDPDRIYFDLHGARLAPELIGKSVDVTDDGYLQRVRTAPYTSGSTRIVLDVSHVSEYSAFLLPNPWRLIIDIHGADSYGTVANGAVLYASAPPAAATAPAPNGASTPPIKKSATALNDVASLGTQPTRVKATRHPTNAPIAAQVSGTTRAPQPNELESLNAAAPPPTATAAHALDAGSSPAIPKVKKTRHKSAAPAQTPGNAPVSAGKQMDAATAPEIATANGHEAMPIASGQRSLVRALGLKIGRIVIDAGHGGHDSGTLGPEGIQEKDVVLDVSLRLGKLLKQRLGADVIYTRDDDTFIPLETRTAIANKAQADLFISVHANSSPDASARGVEVYYLNFTTSPEALEVAARENAVSDQSIYQLSDLVKKITLKDKIDESHEFASDVQSSLYSGLQEGNAGLKDRGIKKAPFVVLIGANMPSILAEISFLTNPEDARQLRDPAYRERIAESLYRGVARYVSGLSGVRVAQNGHSSGR